MQTSPYFFVRFPCVHGVSVKMLHKHAAPVLISALIVAAAPAGDAMKCRMEE